jgi:L-rhamnose isomerase/sugar isomerase
MRMLLEYKLFEPGFYHTDLPDWGSSFALCRRLGERAQVLIDLGHHAHGTNIPCIVATLIAEGKLGGFHFNDRKYADDDLTTGCINPFELTLIFHELVSGWSEEFALMIDEMPVIKPRIESMIQSAQNIQEAYAKALLVDRSALRAAQEENRIIDAERIVHDAYAENVGPILEEARRRRGLQPDPLESFRSSGYRGKIERDRVEKERAAGRRKIPGRGIRIP